MVERMVERMVNRTASFPAAAADAARRSERSVCGGKELGWALGVGGWGEPIQSSDVHQEGPSVQQRISLSHESRADPLKGSKVSRGAQKRVGKAEKKGSEILMMMKTTRWPCLWLARSVELRRFEGLFCMGTDGGIPQVFPGCFQV